jgi:hypothetical protein
LGLGGAWVYDLDLADRVRDTVSRAQGCPLVHDGRRRYHFRFKRERERQIGRLRFKTSSNFEWKKKRSLINE